MKYIKSYIGLNKDGVSKNFVTMIPRKPNMLLYLRIEQNEQTSTELQSADVEMLSYDKTWKLYRMKLQNGDYEKNRDLLQKLMEKAYGEYPY